MTDHDHHDDNDHADAHDHSTITFREIVDNRPSDEVLRRSLSEYSSRRRRKHRALARDHTTLWSRRDQATFSDADKTKFNAAIASLIAAPAVDENYLSFVQTHNTGKSYKMHSPYGQTFDADEAAGTLRFLPWHRAFLLRFEERLREIDPAVTIPYWRWSDPFPDWLDHPEIPAGETESPIVKFARTVGSAQDQPGIVTAIMTKWVQHFAQGGPGIDNYVRFSFALEAGLKINGVITNKAHNHAHMWVGGNMGWLASSPADPVFWLLHAEIDRLWHIWQIAHPTVHPELSGDDRMMNPFGLLYDEVTSIHDLGYTYDDVTPFA